MPADTDPYDVIIIGAGIHGLATAARLREPNGDLLTDDEHTVRRFVSTQGAFRILVIDPSGTWLHNWDTRMEFLDIKHLRSTVMDHPSPFNEHSLFEFHNRNCPDGFRSLDQCFDWLRQHKNAKRPMIDENSRKFFRAPQTNVFRSFCQDIIVQYELQDLIHKDTVQRVVPPSTVSDDMFWIQCGSGERFCAKNVVCAIGGCNHPRIPAWASPYMNRLPKHLVPTLCHLESACTNGVACPQHGSVRGRVLVIGGGLTAAQMVLSQARSGALDIVLLARTPLMTRWLDVPTDIALSRFKQVHSQRYNTMCPEKRMQYLRKHAGKGTIPPDVMENLHGLVAQGVLEIREEVTVQELWLMKSNGTRVSPHDIDTIKESETWYWCALLRQGGNDIKETCSRVLLGTGYCIDATSEPLLQPLIEQGYIHVESGLPVLHPDLRCCDKPLYLLGYYAALELGLMGGNINGAMRGSRIVADAIRSHHDDGENDQEPTTTNRYATLLAADV